MYNFEEVMREWKRMCTAMDKLEPNDCYEACPFHDGNWCGMYSIPKNLDFNKIGEEVMKWAAENPEPIYPTWEEVLLSYNFIKYTIDDKGYKHIHYGWRDRIPAEFAEKLGIAPVNKENK